MTRTRLNDQFLAIIRDPVRFARVLLGQDLWDTQEAILRSVAANPRTAVKACHASSKTFTAAAAVLWWITSHPDGIAITTAPTWHQVERVLWPEIHRAAREAKIGYPQPLQTELRLGPTCYAAGLATDEGVRFQGFHGDILIVIDEAPGVRPDIWEAIEGIRAGGNVHVLALGNPTIANSPFADAFTVDADRWSTLTISAFDTPNLRGLTPQALLALPEDDLDRNERPYLVTRNWVKEKWLEWGQHGSPLWQARVLGQFPDQAEDALFSLAWLEAAKQRDAHDDRKGLPVEIGIDVAGPGEAETAVAVRQGPNLLALRTWQASDSRPPVLAFLAPWRERIATVRVDSVGMGALLRRLPPRHDVAGRGGQCRHRGDSARALRQPQGGAVLGPARAGRSGGSGWPRR